ncbi:hypothetical protein N9L92_01575 [Saprospiraceae bacterium]|nr:hypothetical protein [Saprospiraceae bacterium]
MKIKLLILIAIVCITKNSEAINVSVSTTQFHNGEKSYIEIYSRIIANSVKYMNTDTTSDMTQSSVEYTLMFRKQDAIVIADKYKLDSPISVDAKDYFDLRRYGLDSGTYEIELQYVDLNNISDTLSYTEIIDVKPNNDQLILSDILLMHDVEKNNEKYNYEKAGFFYEPLCFDLVGEEQNVLHMYFENV